MPGRLRRADGRRATGRRADGRGRPGGQQGQGLGAAAARAIVDEAAAAGGDRGAARGAGRQRAGPAALRRRRASSGISVRRGYYQPGGVDGLVMRDCASRLAGRDPAASPWPPAPSSPTSTTTGRCCSRALAAARCRTPSRPCGPTRTSTGRRTTSSWCARRGTTSERRDEFLELGRAGGAVTRAGQLGRRAALEHRQDLPARALRRPGCPSWRPTWLDPGDASRCRRSGSTS